MRQDITKRIKTFSDACEELNRRAEAGDEEAVALLHDYETYGACTRIPDIAAYMQLRIITVALNEDWRPQFLDYEYIYWPWFYFSAEDDIKSMPEDFRSRVFYCGGCVANGALWGLSSVRSSEGFTITYASLGFRLAFKNRELALYAGRQFFEIYAKYLYPTTTK